MEIRSDRQKEMRYTDIARKYHIDPRTAKQYAESPQRPKKMAARCAALLNQRFLNIMGESYRFKERKEFMKQKQQIVNTLFEQSTQ